MGTQQAAGKSIPAFLARMVRTVAWLVGFSARERGKEQEPEQ